MKLAVILFFSLMSFISHAENTAHNLLNSERHHSLERARTWIRPSWIHSDFSFSRNFDVRAIPLTSPNDSHLLSGSITCDHTSAPSQSTGRSPKFFCTLTHPTTGALLLKPDGSPDVLKVKYGHDNGEVYAETAASRLLWALGFGADTVFSLRKTICRGCPQGQSFTPAATERQYPGAKIETYPDQGWNFGELDVLNPNDPHLRAKKIERNALKLLAVFLQHSDNKPENHRLVCLQPLINGACHGEALFIIHDLGATFGGGASHVFGAIRESSKMNLSNWIKAPIWKDAARCQGQLRSKSANGDSSVQDPQIAEESRQFLLRLLTGFSDGSRGWQRLIELFSLAQVEYRGGTPEQWAQAFLDKLEQIRYPLGPQHPTFKCPGIDELRSR